MRISDHLRSEEVVAPLNLNDSATLESIFDSFSIIVVDAQDRFRILPYDNEAGAARVPRGAIREEEQAKK
jgi:hypothetical protein